MAIFLKIMVTTFTEIFLGKHQWEEIKVVKDQYGTPTNTETVADFIIKIILSLPQKGFIIVRVMKLCHGMILQIKL